MSELRRAARTLVRQPAYGLAVIATLALAMGVTTGFFGVIDALTLRPLPGVETRGLVSLHVTRRGALEGFSGFSGPGFRAYRDRSHTLAGLEAFVGRDLAVASSATGTMRRGRVRLSSSASRSGGSVLGEGKTCSGRRYG